VHQLLRTLTCASLIAFTGVIGVGMLTAVAIKLQVVTPAALLCGVKSWLNQECGPKPESTEVETAAEVAVAPTTEQPVEDSPHLTGAEPSREIFEIAVAPPQEESGARETQYNVASAQTEVLGSRDVLREKSMAGGSEQPEQPLATEKGGASKQASGRPARQETVRRALAKRNDQRRLNVVARETLHDVPVNISDGTQRRIDIRPTSLQDVYYYSAPR
jgi:hypothetical protein